MYPIRASLLLLLVTSNNSTMAMEYVQPIINFAHDFKFQDSLERVTDYFINGQIKVRYVAAACVGALFVWGMYKNNRLRTIEAKIAFLEDNVAYKSAFGEMKRIETKVDLIASRFDILTADLNFLWGYIFSKSKIEIYNKEHFRAGELSPVRPHLVTPSSCLREDIEAIFLQFSTDNMGFKGDDVEYTMAHIPQAHFQSIVPLISPRARTASPTKRSPRSESPPLFYGKKMPPQKKKKRNDRQQIVFQKKLFLLYQ